ncbi:MAG: hypothetical protein M3546_14465 [Actinomycetota bacterium]|nr:hypothetical protein [Actinomycetota bacterium]
MNDIELLASVLATLWLGILTLVMLLVIRQIGLITLRLDIASQPAVLPADGLNFGVRVPVDAVGLVPGLKNGLVYVLLVAGTCTPCRELVPHLSSVRTRGQVLTLVPGREEFASDLIQMLPRSEVVRDPAATEVAKALEMERTPAVLEIEDGIATGKAHLFSAKDFQNLIDARDQSDASEIARLAKEGETHAIARA